MLADMVRPTREVTRSRLLGGLAGEGQREDAVGMGAVLDAAHDRLDEGGGLAGAGPGQHQEGATAVVDDALLLLVERRRTGGEGGPDHAVGLRLRHRLTPPRTA